MAIITPIQSQNARRLMAWSQEDLAGKAKIGIQTVRNFERGESTRPETIAKICNALENSGILFFEDDGVKRRNKWCEVYSGEDSCDRLFEIMTASARLCGGEVGAFINDSDILLAMSGYPRHNNLERLDILHELVKIRCVLLASAVHPDITPSFEYKATPDVLVPFGGSVFTFGKQYADIQYAPDGRFIIVVYDLSVTAQSYRRDIDNLWQQAMTLEVTHNPSSRSQGTKVPPSIR